MLARAIQSKDYSVRIRAIQELGRIVEYDASVETLLIDHLFCDEVALDAEFFEAVKALARAKPTAVEKIINTYDSNTSRKEELERLLFVLGRMGPKAKPGISFLLRQLARHKGDAQVEGDIRVVLANVGYKSAENLGTILSDIQNRTQKGKAEIRMMTLASPRNWIEDELVKELCAWFNQSPSGQEGKFLAISLAVLGKIDMPMARRLHAFVKGHCAQGECEEPACIWFGFSLGKFDQTKTQGVLTPALRCLADDSPGLSFHVADVLVGDILIGSDRQMMRELAKMLDDGHPAVVSGALWMLLGIGLDARHCAPDVFKVLNSNPDEDLRQLAASALAYMADPCDIPTLEAILEKEPSEFVRDETVDAIRILRLEEKRE